MSSYVDSVTINCWDGHFNQTLRFTPGLNIIGGENGTGKTQVLKQIKAGTRTVSPPNSTVRVYALSPKRNAERRAIEAVVGQFRDTLLTTAITQRIGEGFDDATFTKYHSVQELFYMVFNDRLRPGNASPQSVAREVAAEFTGIIQETFPDYRLEGDWNPNSGVSGNPTLSLLKSGGIPVPASALSCGEQEVFSLILNLYLWRDSSETFLIDEPELHLNWSLEERLFTFFQSFSARFHRQVIVVTHSRVIFTEPFYGQCQFLRWIEGQVVCTRELTPAERNRVAGEAIEVVRLGDSNRPSFFVEDEAQRQVLSTLSKSAGSDVVISPCGNKANVQSLFEHFRARGDLAGKTFIRDGDGEGNPFPGEPSFVHLSRYCIENYLLDLEAVSRVTGLTDAVVKAKLIEAIRDRGGRLLPKQPRMTFLLERLNPQDLDQKLLDSLNASEFLDAFLGKVGVKRDDFLERYVGDLATRGKLREVFPEGILDRISRLNAVDSPPPQSPSASSRAQE
jgi:hypothetical protein